LIFTNSATFLYSKRGLSDNIQYEKNTFAESAWSFPKIPKALPNGNTRFLEDSPDNGDTTRHSMAPKGIRDAKILNNDQPFSTTYQPNRPEKKAISQRTSTTYQPNRLGNGFILQRSCPKSLREAQSFSTSKFTRGKEVRKYRRYERI
jgi:hypothetical protein